MALVCRLAVHYPDAVIAGILNRQQRTTAYGHRSDILGDCDVHHMLWASRLRQHCRFASKNLSAFFSAIVRNLVASTDVATVNSAIGMGMRLKAPGMAEVAESQPLRRLMRCLDFMIRELVAKLVVARLIKGLRRVGRRPPRRQHLEQSHVPPRLPFNDRAAGD